MSIDNATNEDWNLYSFEHNRKLSQKFKPVFEEEYSPGDVRDGLDVSNLAAPCTETTTPQERYGSGGIECIEAIRSALTDEEFRGFCKGNMIKYIWRERHKQGDDALRKARDYISQLLEGRWSEQ